MGKQQSVDPAIRRRMAARPLRELLAIWRNNDRKEWSDGAFDAIRDILMSKGIPLIPQQAWPHRGGDEQHGSRLCPICASASVRDRKTSSGSGTGDQVVVLSSRCIACGGQGAAHTCEQCTSYFCAKCLNDASSPEAAKHLRTPPDEPLYWLGRKLDLDRDTMLLLIRFARSSGLSFEAAKTLWDQHGTKARDAFQRMIGLSRKTDIPADALIALYSAAGPTVGAVFDKVANDSGYDPDKLIGEIMSNSGLSKREAERVVAEAGDDGHKMSCLIEEAVRNQSISKKPWWRIWA